MIKNYKKQIAKAILITGISVLTLTSCSRMTDSLTDGSTEDTAVVTDVVSKPISVNGTRAEIGSINSSIEIAGTVATGNPVAVIGEASGTLRNFSLEVGDKVVADEVIAQIDPSRPGMNYKMKDVKAPITGTVVTVSSKEGSLSSPSAPLAILKI